MIAIAVKDTSQVAEARRHATAMARQQGFGEADGGRAALVATELATNLVKHGNGGEILVGTDEDGNNLQIVALDQGRGMADVGGCLRDGYSSAGTAGHGLGAVVRQADFVDIASWLGVGTAVLTQIDPKGRTGPGSPAPARYGAVSIAKPGESVCGDSWAIERSGAAATLFVADGLGHGQAAAEASVQAVRLFRRFRGHQVPTLLDYVHGGLRLTRGAAVSIARFDPDTKQVIFAGIGNVTGILAVRGEAKQMVCMPGTAGYNVRKIQAFQYPFQDGLIILYSDGLRAGLTLSRYPNLEAAHPTLIAAVLYRDFSRHHDDATVLVGKWPAGTPP